MFYINLENGVYPGHSSSLMQYDLGQQSCSDINRIFGAPLAPWVKPWRTDLEVPGLIST